MNAVIRQENSRGAQVDPGVSAAVHYVSSLYYKAKKDFAEFYKSSLLYLAFVSSDKLEHEYKLVRACCLPIVGRAGRALSNTEAS